MEEKKRERGRKENLPLSGIEPEAFALQVRCSTTKLKWRVEHLTELGKRILNAVIYIVSSNPLRVLRPPPLPQTTKTLITNRP